VNQQPRRNQKRHYRYPMHRVVAVIDDDAGTEAALDALPEAGVDVAAVDVLSGPEGARLLDTTGTRHGLRGRLLRLVQQGAYEGNALQTHDEALRAGGNVIYVPVRGDDQRDRVVDILHAAGGRYVLYFRRWSVDLLPRG
jgi:hypothetical protein